MTEDLARENQRLRREVRALQIQVIQQRKAVAAMQRVLLEAHSQLQASEDGAAFYTLDGFLKDNVSAADSHEVL